MQFFYSHTGPRKHHTFFGLHGFSCAILISYNSFIHSWLQTTWSVPGYLFKSLFLLSVLQHIKHVPISWPWDPSPFLLRTFLPRKSHNSLFSFIYFPFQRCLFREIFLDQPIQESTFSAWHLPLHKMLSSDLTVTVHNFLML